MPISQETYFHCYRCVKGMFKRAVANMVSAFDDFFSSNLIQAYKAQIYN